MQQLHVKSINAGPSAVLINIPTRDNSLLLILSLITALFTHTCPQIFLPDAIVYLVTAMASDIRAILAKAHSSILARGASISRSYFTVPAHKRKEGKLGQVGAVNGFFLGYSHS